LTITLLDWDRESGEIFLFDAVATTRRHPAMHSQSPGEPNLCQLLIDLQGGKGLHQVIIGSSDERSVQLSHTRLGRHQHNDPGVFDRLVPQTSDELQAIYLVWNPIDQYKIGCAHST
jgi:hypothetical protein